jgi:hypothetical protein
VEAPTRTPIPKVHPSRKPTSTERPTRTPLTTSETNTRKPTFTARATRTPVTTSSELNTRKPTFTARPTRTPIPPPPPPMFSEGGVTAVCSLVTKNSPDDKPDLLHVELTIENGSGAAVTVSPNRSLDVSGGAFSYLRSPGNGGRIPASSSLNFEWDLHSSAALSISASFSLTGPDGSTSTRSVSCE